MNNEKFDIFVSYAHEDKRFVGEVIQKLSSSGGLTRKFIMVKALVHE